MMLLLLFYSYYCDDDQRAEIQSHFRKLEEEKKALEEAKQAV